jgi:hypothetical protein
MICHVDQKEAVKVVARGEHVLKREVSIEVVDASGTGGEVSGWCRRMKWKKRKKKKKERERRERVWRMVPPPPSALSKRKTRKKIEKKKSLSGEKGDKNSMQLI